MSIFKKILLIVDSKIFKHVVNLCYSQYYRPDEGYLKYYQVLRKYFFAQKILRINGRVPWPVDFRSTIRGWEHIKKGIMCDPGDNQGIYINAYGGLILGDNVGISSNTVIVTTNHDKYNHRQTSNVKGVVIGNNVWIGANCVILPGTIIGDEVTIGAGTVVSGVIPSKTTVTGGRDLVIKEKKLNYQWDIYSVKLNRKTASKNIKNGDT